MNDVIETTKNVQLREQDLAKLRQIFSRFPWVSEVRVFGSRAKGNARRASDVDLCVSAPGVRPTVWSELIEALDEAPIIYELEVLRMDQLSQGDFLYKILREGVVIYTKQPPSKP
ncbi:MAG: nucleotidyltransferase domain-containing protein [Planctomycetes bacterium]|nr:nucleotidyltransferase domain-containing protein [Planctomycetota bacterium]